MNKNKLIETVLLFGSLGFLVMWVNEFIYKGSEIKDSYFFLMFALAGFLFYTYRRGSRVQLEKQAKQNDVDDKKKPVVKTTASSKVASSKAAISKKKKQSGK